MPPSRPKTSGRGSYQNVTPAATPKGEAAAPNVPPKTNITVDTSVAGTDLDNAKLSLMSPGVRDVAEHAAQLNAVLLQVSAIYDMVGRQALQMAEISPAVIGRDQVASIRGEMETRQKAQKEKIEATLKTIEAEKKKVLDTINEKITTIVQEFVASQVKKRVKDEIQKHVELLEKQVQGNRGRILRHQLMFDNIEARNRNSTIRSKWPREQITQITQPLSVMIATSQSPSASPKSTLPPAIKVTVSQNFPSDFQGLLCLSAPVAKGLIKEYGLQESEKRQEEDRHFENLNRLMSHFGIGYRLNPGGPKPILTSVWDR